MQQKMMENIAMQMFDKPLTILTTVRPFYEILIRHAFIMENG